MKSLTNVCRLPVIVSAAVLTIFAANTTSAQVTRNESEQVVAADTPLPAQEIASTSDLDTTESIQQWTNECQACECQPCEGNSLCDGQGCCCGSPVCDCCREPSIYGGAEFLLVRPRFSESIAFARGQQAATSLRLKGREIDFDYDGSLRAFAGYQMENNAGKLQFMYWRFRGDTSIEGASQGPGDFIVDPFGNVVGAFMVIDPQSALFGNMVVGGNHIQTHTNTETNIYDLDIIKPVLTGNSNWELEWSAGVRITDVDQFYESVITTAGGAVFSQGDFSVDFTGAGPRIGLQGRCHRGSQRRLSIFASVHGSLLVGEYDVVFNNLTTVPAAFAASQEENLTRTIPVVESEMGATWQVCDRLGFSAGWLFQSWFDMGASGGTFGGLFTGADDSNVMSFDGLFLRGEVAY